jgi:hypothetical protein
MGFAIMPERIKPGVYIYKYSGELVFVESACGYFWCDVWHKSRQKIPRIIGQNYFQPNGDFEYLGEL